jgi:hypothetical protein
LSLTRLARVFRGWRGGEVDAELGGCAFYVAVEVVDAAQPVGAGGVADWAAADGALRQAG